MSDASTAEIAIRVRTVAQLFNSLDPSPFRDKDIDAGVEDFVVGWVRELPRDRPIALAVYLPADEATKPEAAGIAEAFGRYFAGRAEALRRDLRELFRVGRQSLAIGVAVLIVCLIASQVAAGLIENQVAARVIEESLIIVGWVANWRPIEIYLYDWWPIRRRQRRYERIAAAPVTVKSI